MKLHNAWTLRRRVRDAIIIENKEPKGKNMLENIHVNWQSSICLETGGAVIYLDPWQLTEEIHDADIVCITHSHHDHFSPEDIAKAAKEDTVLIAPESAAEEISGKTAIAGDNILFIRPGEEVHFGDISITGIPAYNVGKPFHKKENGWLGFIIEADGTKYYCAGDTDVNEDIRQVRCDVALIPIGGHYTMNVQEAADYINEIAPEFVIPTHFGCVENAGSKNDDTNFLSRINENTKVVLKLHKRG